MRPAIKRLALHPFLAILPVDQSQLSGQFIRQTKRGHYAARAMVTRECPHVHVGMSRVSANGRTGFRNGQIYLPNALGMIAPTRVRHRGEAIGKR